MSRQGRQQLGGQSHLLDAALWNMLHGLCMFDAEHRLILCNAAYARTYDLPPELTVAGTPRSAILDHCVATGCGPADMAEFLAIAQEAEEQGRPAERNLKLTDGRYIKISHSPIDDHTYVATHQDVTEKVRTAQELARANDTLEARVRERTALVWRQAEALERLLAHEREVNDNQRQFVTMASHEFRTPLTIIDGAAQRLLRHRDGDAIFVAEKAEQIRASVARIIDLIEGILESGRHDAGLAQPVYDRVDLSELVRMCCERQAGISPNHRFHIDLAALPPTIAADRSALDLVFTNLLSNAVKYSREAPDIHVTATLTGEVVTIAVRDGGVGIDAEDLPRMFQRYFRARTSTGIAGTGLGLHLVRQIVELHQGSVEVKSARGHGSTFTVHLPAEPSIALPIPSESIP